MEANIAKAPQRGSGVLLGVLLTATFLCQLTTTMVNIGVPSIQSALGASDSQAEWLVGAYALAYGIMLVPGGRLGDLIGRRPLFLSGLAGFLLAALGAAVAATPSALIIWNGVQGASAGLMLPQVIGAIPATFPLEQRAEAFGLYGAVSGIAVALGPVLGGALIAFDPAGLSWRSVFLIDVPIAAATLVAAWFLIPDSQGDGGKIDLLGAALLAIGLLLLLVPLSFGRSIGWPPGAIIALLCAAPVFAIFFAAAKREATRGGSPLLDPRFFASRAFLAGMAIAVFFFAAINGLLFAMSIFLQAGVQTSPLHAGLILLAFTVGNVLSATASGPLTRAFGRGAMSAGALLTLAGAAGVLLFLRFDGLASTGELIAVPLMAMGLGCGLVIAPNVNFALAEIGRGAAATAGGAISAAQRVGQAIGVAGGGELLFGNLGAGGRIGFVDGLEAVLVAIIICVALTFVGVFFIPKASPR